jgi:hypothetical protein
MSQGREDPVGIEVKAAETIKGSDLRGLKKLSSRAGDQFRMVRR